MFNSAMMTSSARQVRQESSLAPVLVFLDGQVRSATHSIPPGIKSLGCRAKS